MTKKRADTGASAAIRSRRRLRTRRRTQPDLSGELEELRDRERRLEQARSQYADLFDFAPVTYALLDSAGVVLKINLAGCRLLETERVRLIGHPLLTRVVDDDRRELLEHLRRCRAARGMVESEIRFTSDRGRVVTCRVFSHRASHDGGIVLPTVIVDQTDQLALDEARVVAERRREKAERDSEVAQAASGAKDQFLATVSHELRTPLTPALFAASRLAGWEGLPDQARQLAAVVKRNLEYEARLIDDLLDVARINRDRVSLRLEVVDAHDVIREAIGICNPLAESNRVSLTAHLLAATHHVSADRTRLRQVYWNILNNAIKFTPAGGSVVIGSANPDEATFRMTVRDSGTGMDPDVLERLFAPFDTQRSDHPSRMGLGLGLAICKGIIAAHGGQIWASSDGPDRGSTFAVELASVAEARDHVADRPLRSGDGPDAGALRRVLVIEDDPDSGEMLSLFLSQHGYDVEVATTLGTGLRKLNQPWDVVLSDIGLPDGSGLEIARRARRLERPPSHLIAFTGFGSSDDVAASREAGFDVHVVKPVDLDRLLSTIRAPSVSDGHVSPATSGGQRAARARPDANK